MQIAIGQVGAGQHAGHAAVHGIEAMAVAQEIVRRLRRTADAGELGHPVRFEREFETGLDQRRADGIVSAARAQRRDASFIIAVGDSPARCSAGPCDAAWAWRCRSLFRGLLADGSHAAGDHAGDVACRDRRAVIVQQRDEARGIDPAFGDEQLLQLRVAVLLDHEHLIMRLDELRHLVGKGEGAHAQRVQMQSVFVQRLQRFVHRHAGGAEIDRAPARRRLGGAQDRARHQRLGGLELAQQALGDLDMDRAIAPVGQVEMHIPQDSQVVSCKASPILGAT